MGCPVYPIRVPKKLLEPPKGQKKCPLLNLPPEILVMIFKIITPNDAISFAISSNHLLQMAHSINLPVPFAPAHVGGKWAIPAARHKVDPDFLRWNHDLFENMATTTELELEIMKITAGDAAPVAPPVPAGNGGGVDEEDSYREWSFKPSGDPQLKDGEGPAFVMKSCRCAKQVSLLGQIGIEGWWKSTTQRPLGRSPKKTKWSICRVCQKFRPTAVRHWVEYGKKITKEKHYRPSVPVAAVAGNTVERGDGAGGGSNSSNQSSATANTTTLNAAIMGRIGANIAAIMDIDAEAEADSLDGERLQGIDDMMTARNIECDMDQWMTAALTWSQFWISECPDCYMQWREGQIAVDPSDREGSSTTKRRATVPVWRRQDPEETEMEDL